MKPIQECTHERRRKNRLLRLRGGYYENLEPDWSVSPGGFCTGDRKGLDTHMHLMEAFTTLTAASGREILRRKFLEIIDLILRHMVNRDAGEWRTLLDRKGAPIDPKIGNPRKVAYHTGRSAIECVERLERLTKTCLKG